MINLFVLIVLIGLCVWALGLIPLPEPFKQIILVVGVIIVVVALLKFFLGIDILSHKGMWS